MYDLLRSLLFRLPPEIAHDLSLGAIDLASSLNLAGTPGGVPDDPVSLWNLEFPNPVGLAAGLDKSGDHFNALGKLGFGFVEIGTVTPKPQPGNPAPRVFRLPEYEAIINRMGFNNRGVDHLVARARRRTYDGVLGINIGKNAATPVENAVDDYVIGIDRVFPYADYVAINISSPNTAGLRSLQHGDELESLLETMKERQAALADEHGKDVPLLVKIAPDLEDAEIADIAGIVTRLEIDGVIATNTTVARDAVAGHRYAEQTGGLSGAPLQSASTHVIAALYAELGDDTPIIGVGGITDGDSAVEKIEAGARLVQLYTGFIYHGPALIAEAARAIASARRA
ncbi:MAG: quinone-dependent dihydroorotate dehydrogenase [Woeseiaceae bacterium]